MEGKKEYEIEEAYTLNSAVAEAFAEAPDLRTKFLLHIINASCGALVMMADPTSQYTVEDHLNQIGLRLVKYLHDDVEFMEDMVSGTEKNLTDRHTTQ